MRKSEDALLLFHQELLRTLRHGDAPLPGGSALGPDEPLLIHPADEESFRRVALQLLALPGCVPVLDAHVFTEDEYHEIESRADVDPSESTADDSLVEARAHIGQVSSVTLFATFPLAGTSTVLSLTADWFASLPFDDEDAFEAAEPSLPVEPPLSESEVERIALAIANDADYQGARINDKQYAADKVIETLGVEVPDYQWRTVFSRAHQLWEFDIKKRQNAELKVKARELFEGGMPKKRIALELGITTTRLAELI